MGPRVLLLPKPLLEANPWHRQHDTDGDVIYAKADDIQICDSKDCFYLPSNHPDVHPRGCGICAKVDVEVLIPIPNTSDGMICLSYSDEEEGYKTRW